MEACRDKHRSAEQSLIIQGVELFCRATWDEVLCWPPTAAGRTVHLPCPPHNAFDPSKSAMKVCKANGLWQEEEPAAALQLDDRPDEPIQQNVGFTDYTECYLPGIYDIVKKMGTPEDYNRKMEIAGYTRYLEVTGLSISLAALVLSLFIFFYFRSLQNHRTRIHKNLFVAIGIQIIVRLTLYTDQAVARVADDQQIINTALLDNSTTATSVTQQESIGIHTTEVVCETFYIVLEYARTTMFVWMFIEGLYLHNLITVMVFRPDTYHKLYLAFGWGIPVILTAVWAGYTATQQSTPKCWFGYSLTPSYWFLEGPRLLIIAINLLYLLNILRVLVTKLRNSQCSEAEQVRKALKAAFVLLPLLGITNALVMVPAPLDRSPEEFAVWSFTSHFLTSFQGFFVSLLYCFLNGEVRSTLKKKLNNYLADRQILNGGNRFFHYNTTQVEMDRVTVNDHQAVNEQPPVLTVSPPGEKHPKGLLRTQSPTPPAYDVVVVGGGQTSSSCATTQV